MALYDRSSYTRVAVFCFFFLKLGNRLNSRLVYEDRASTAIHLPGAFAKTKKATNILRPAIDVTFDKDAEFEVFSDSRRFFHGFFLEKVTLYGEVAIKSR